MAKVLTGIEESWRYYDNAKALLEKAGADYDIGYYKDPKYIKLAGHALYSGVLMAINEAFPVKKGGGREDVKDFREALKRDKKAIAMFNGLYSSLHLSLGYDGSTSIKTVRAALEDTKYFLAYIEDRWL